MNRRASAIILLVGVVACTVSPSVPTAMPTLTPNRIETGVAGTKTASTEGTAIAMTVEASKATQTPPPTKTSEPTLTKLPPSPTVAPQATSSLECKVNLIPGTAYLTPSPNRTPEPNAVYAIKVKSVDKVTSYSVLTGTGLPQVPRTVYPDTGYVFLKIAVEFYNNGVLAYPLDNTNRLRLSVVDSKDNVYQLANQDYVILGTLICLDTGNAIYNHEIVYFAVPNGATGFKLRYRDLPLIDLGL